MEQKDVVVIGAGFSGMYSVYRLRKDYDVVCLEAGSGVGGTWYWNRYPGARVDIQSVEYSYGFDEDLQQEWQWPEYFSAQPDLERYANHVADRFGLRDHIRLSSRVTSLAFDGEANQWHVRTAQGDHIVCRYVVAATGSLVIPHEPEWPGRQDFKGQLLHTTQWPREGVDFTGKKVGIVGTGSTGIQAIPEIAAEAEHLYVFQRTPAYSMPSGNRPLDAEYENEWKSEYAERRKRMLDMWGASIIDYGTRSAHDCTPEERERIMEEAWTSQKAAQVLVCFSDVMSDEGSNEYVAEFVRNKIRGIVKDPKVAELLCPGYPIGAKRLCIDNGYYETFNRDNVTLVDVRSAPITAFTPAGLQTADATYALDALVLATGFDAVTGSMMHMDIEGLNGVKLADKWRDGPTTYLGAMVAGFPNLFMIHGPMTPAAQAQMITTGEWMVNWVADIIDGMERDGCTRIDTTEEAEQGWAQEVDDRSQETLHRLADSWYNAKNIEGKKGGFMIYVGGFPRFAQLSNEAVADGYRGFVRQ